MSVSSLHKKSSWQLALSEAIQDPRQLLEMLELDASLLESALSAAKLFPLKAPRGFVQRMKKGDINDPLLKQILPLGAELKETEGYSKDPLGEAAANPVSGLLHKYKGRVLVTLVGACGVNCRFCFRRHFPYADNNPGSEGWDEIMNYIAADPTIQEVILSGGDPLVANDKTLQLFSNKLQAIPHVTRLRIHSRMPIVLPERITPDFVEWARGLRQKLILVTHCNHPQEIDASVTEAMQRLTQAGVVLLNQAVLLKDINDNVETLMALSETLFAAGIQPYYLHLLDKVQGAAHFDIDLASAKALHWELNQHLSGYLVPKLVYEKAGAPAKLPVELYTG